MAGTTEGIEDSCRQGMELNGGLTEWTSQLFDPEGDMSRSALSSERPVVVRKSDLVDAILWGLPHG